MKSGLLTFIAIIVWLAVSWFILSRAVSVQLNKQPAVNPAMTQSSSRVDFADGKQRTFHSGAGAYTEEYYVPKPATSKQLGIDQHQEAWMKYWAKREGHKL